MLHQALNRRALIRGMAASVPGCLLPWANATAAGSILHLDPSRIKDWRQRVKGHQISGSKGKIDYADENPQNGKVTILSFHGTSAPYEISMPLQYPLLESGYRIIMPNRPSYGETSTAWGVRAHQIADMAYRLLESLNIRDPVVVMGTSAGGPGALAFASKYADATKAVILNSAVSHIWTEPRFVPLAGGLRDRFRGAETLSKIFFDLFDAQDAYKALAQGIFYLAGVPSVSFDKEVVGLGENLNEANLDSAYGPFVEMFTEDKLKAKTAAGVQNDYLNLYLADAGFVANWKKIKAPTLLTHCTRDIVVPTDHSLFVREKLRSNSTLITPERVAGHITALGTDANALHDRIRTFLQAQV